jgi:hypothetical protein
MSAQLPKCLVGLDACGSAHHWARELIKLGHGLEYDIGVVLRTLLPVARFLPGQNGEYDNSSRGTREASFHDLCRKVRQGFLLGLAKLRSLIAAIGEEFATGSDADRAEKSTGAGSRDRESEPTSPVVE